MAEKEIHLRDYLRVINKRRITVGTFFLVTMLIVVITTFTATPMYQAANKVMIEKNSGSALGPSHQYIQYDPEFLETQYQVIKSGAVAKKVVGYLNVEQFYDLMFPEKKEEPGTSSSFTAWLTQIITSVKSGIGIDQTFTELQNHSENDNGDESSQKIPPTKAEILEAVIRAGINVTPLSNSRVVQLSFWSSNPAVAAKIVNSVAQAYIDELMEMQMQVSGYSIGWMTKKAEVQRKKLEESEQALHNYKKKHDIITIEDRLAVLPERLSDLSRSLTQAETRKKELASLYEQIKNTPKNQLETISNLMNDASMAPLNQAILAAGQKISELSKKYGPKHPRMIAANNELAALKAKKKQELDKAVMAIQHEYQLAQSHEKGLKERLDQTKFQTAQLGEKSIQLKILKRKVETNRFLYDALVKTMKERGITEQNQSVNVWVIEKAKIPEYPASPRKKRNILLGIILGLFGGIGVAFFLEYLDNTIKTPEDVEEKLNMPVIAAIDKQKMAPGQSVASLVIENPSSLVAENFKALRTSLFLSSAETPPKIIMVTSMTPGEGKSSISTGLAAVIAQAGKKVLIVDADMRRPTIHKVFSLDHTTGLSSFLAGVEDISRTQLIHRSVASTKTLDVMTAGPIPPNPSELLSSYKLRKFIQKASVIYDIVIIDTPPVGSVADPLIISPYVDKALIVSWTGKTTYELLGKGLRQLKDVSAPVSGIVLNRFSAKKTGYYYNYGDYYYTSDT